MTVLITGAKGGLGSAVTQAFLDAGATVAGVSRSIRDSDFNHPSFFAVPGELTSFDAVRSVVDAMVSRTGRVDALVHLVGSFVGGSVVETDEHTADEQWNVNFRSTFLMVKAVVPVMRAQGAGRIVATGSRAAIEATANAGVYSASKAAVVALIRAVAAENADAGISGECSSAGDDGYAGQSQSNAGCRFLQLGCDRAGSEADCRTRFGRLVSCDGRGDPDLRARSLS
jgi:NAD(P)-dependent dehydrogenase (short-subunit alcohol dehydrogenase family)